MLMPIEYVVQVRLEYLGKNCLTSQLRLIASIFFKLTSHWIIYYYLCLVLHVYNRVGNYSSADHKICGQMTAALLYKFTSLQVAGKCTAALLCEFTTLQVAGKCTCSIVV